jgi:hypothetical protein
MLMTTPPKRDPSIQISLFCSKSEDDDSTTKSYIASTEMPNDSGKCVGTDLWLGSSLFRGTIVTLT